MKITWKAVIGFIIGVIVTVGVFESAARVQERSECEDWKKYEAQADLLGISSQPWQREQCLNYGIKINY